MRACARKPCQVMATVLRSSLKTPFRYQGPGTAVLKKIGPLHSRSLFDGFSGLPRGTKPWVHDLKGPFDGKETQTAGAVASSQWWFKTHSNEGGQSTKVRGAKSGCPFLSNNTQIKVCCFTQLLLSWLQVWLELVVIRRDFKEAASSQLH